MITLSDGIRTVQLSKDLYWPDEFSWSSVEQKTDRGLTGALIVQAMRKTSGQPITLMPHDSNSGAMTRATVDQLQAWVNTPGQILTLTLASYGKTFRVIWNHEDGAREAEPFVFFSDPNSGHYLMTTLRFITVE